MVDQISSDRLRLLVRLDDGQPHGDSLGVRLRSLSDEDMVVADDLKRNGLAEVVGGWNNVFWLRLTERGWKMRLATRTA